MQIAVSNSALMNVEESFLQNAKYFLERLQVKYPYKYKVDEVDDSYSNEVIQVLFYNHASSFLSGDIIVVTNYRIFSVGSVNDFTSNNYIVLAHSFVDSIKDITSKDTYIEIDVGRMFVFKSKDETDQVFVTAGNNLANRILDAKNKLVDAKSKATPVPEPVEENTNSGATDNDEASYTTDSGGFIFVGPKTDEYEYEDMVYVQALNINWVGNTGDFLRAMDKVVNNFRELVGPDECIFNMRYTTQSMGDSYSVNAVGDLCKKKQKEKLK